jgi:hypothetical protein
MGLRQWLLTFTVDLEHPRARTHAAQGQKVVPALPSPTGTKTMDELANTAPSRWMSYARQKLLRSAPTATVVTLDNYFVSMSYLHSKKPARIPPIPDGLAVSKFPPVGSASYCHQEHPQSCL